MNLIGLFVFSIVVSSLLPGTNYHNRKVSLIILGAFWILFIGLRIKYNDTAQYIWEYSDDYDILGFSDFIRQGNFSLSINPGYRLMCSILKALGANAHWYIFLFSAFYTSVYLWFLGKYASHFSDTIFVFFVMGFVFLMAALKQVTATAIALIAVDRYLQNHRFKSLILLIIAMTFHPYVLILAVIPFFLANKPWGKQMNMLVLGILILGFAFSFTVSLASRLTVIIGDNYNAEDLLSGGLSIGRFLVYLAPCLLSFFLRNVLYDSESDEIDNLTANSMIFAMGIMFVALFGSPALFGRLPAYFSPLFSIGIGSMLEKIQYRVRGGRLIKYTVLLFYAIYFYYANFIDRDFNTRYQAITLGQLLFGS